MADRTSAQSSSDSDTPDEKPLQGISIGIALAEDFDYAPGSQLKDFGAIVKYYPSDNFEPLADHSLIDDSLKDIASGEIDNIILPTPFSFHAVVSRIEKNQRDPSMLANCTIVVVGYDTRMALLSHPATAGLELSVTVAESLRDAANELPLASNALLPTSTGLYDETVSNVEDADMRVSVVPAYRSVIGRGGDDLPVLLWAGEVDVVVFVSAHNVRHFAIRLRHDGGTLAMLDDVIIACIDSATSQAAETFDLKNIVIAEQPHIEALVDVLLDHLTSNDS